MIRSEVGSSSNPTVDHSLVSLEAYDFTHKDALFHHFQNDFVTIKFKSGILNLAEYADKQYFHDELNGGDGDVLTTTVLYNRDPVGAIHTEKNENAIEVCGAWIAKEKRNQGIMRQAKALFLKSVFLPAGVGAVTTRVWEPRRQWKLVKTLERMGAEKTHERDHGNNSHLYCLRKEKWSASQHFHEDID